VIRSQDDMGKYDRPKETLRKVENVETRIKEIVKKKKEKQKKAPASS
jgi:hypothetical protein